MKNVALNTLNYTGVVTLSRYTGQKKVKLAQIHNTGGLPLFNFLANCLTGDFASAKDEYPTKIKLVNRETIDTDVYEYSSVSGFIFLRRPVEIVSNNSGECRVRYSFMIPRALKSDLGV